MELSGQSGRVEDSALRIQSGAVRVYTFKAGLLARAAHDLRLTVERFEIRYDLERVTATFEPTSIRVDGSMRRGKLDEEELSASNRADIERTIREDILRAREHPLLRYAGTHAARGSRIDVDGELELRGRVAPVSFALDVVAGRLHGHAELSPSRWGIEPYKALLGAIQLQDRLIVEFDLADPR